MRKRASSRFALAMVAGALSAAVAVLAAADYQPARLLSGTPPKPPFNAIGWVEAVIDLELDSAGNVVKTTGLRATPGGLDTVLPALKTWRFKAANDGEHSVASHVLVAALMRPAQYTDPAGGSPAVDLKPQIENALFPLSVTRPKYPAKRVGNQTVLVEAQVAANGRVERAAIIGPSSGFDEEAQTTARSWVFSAARHEGATVPGVAYLIFGFRAPVSGPLPQ